MRLRYLHLPRCGPLTDTSVVFGREALIEETLTADPSLVRKGALNFVVGVNGSGKSSILRTLYRIFLSLARRERPALPATLAWDRRAGQEMRTAILHITNLKERRSFFAILARVPDRVPSQASRPDWQALIKALGDEQPHPLAQDLEIEHGEDAVQIPLSTGLLPKRLIAYSSGAEDAWIELDRPEFHSSAENGEPLPTAAERPPGWSMEREWEEQLRQPSGPSDTVRDKLATNRMLDAEPTVASHVRVRSPDLRLAGITLTLWQAGKELKGKTGEAELEALRRGFLREQAEPQKPQNARRVLNEIDWFRPTHLSLVYLDADERATVRQRQELFCLLALADAVVAQPGGRMRAVIPLGPADDISLTERLRETFPLGIPGRAVERIAERVDGSKTGAEAVLRIFSADETIDSTPLDVFIRLRNWQQGGLLDEVTVTIERLHRRGAEAGEQDDSETDDAANNVLVTYDQLSDGEQMLLGRMGLIFLLRGQDGSLLLMDEPETHFNDVWKREIVEMLDMGLLNSTEANVIVATHTSIALTDAFAAEVTVLDKTRGAITARAVGGGLFGTDPSEVNMSLFRADSSTGRRSELILDRLLKTEWEGKEPELEAILSVLGSSFHRAELRAILKRLRAEQNGPASS